ncbi:type I polyketide synthase [Anaeromicropila populeti]|uniref:Phosphopantetheine attachment site n=1 Tax=Anaeromicropila populeti TaxID=37658 RepID=A0A1I6ITA3_9FIRM|nr:SDR family NAD(P)-dependent oxidoreductase [Anaeromicropila populeti]SFR69965.1 Phosphopantetheine attachment site [Anaeromicropila populeti]
MEAIKNYILEQVSKKLLTQQDALVMLQEMKNETGKFDEQIAVIGMACNLPESENYNEFWDNLIAERECLNYLPKAYTDYYRPTENPYYAEFLGSAPNDVKKNRLSKRSAYIKDSDCFDATFFNVPPREAKHIDPCHRMFMQTAWSALEDSGYGFDRIQGSNTGVFVGRDHNSSGLYKMLTENDTLSTVGSWESILASRLSYLFNLRGPAIVVDTACSSGLTAVHQACNALKNSDCEMAIAGGISIGGGASADSEDEDAKKDALDAVDSDDRTVRSFDKKSSGTVFGEGVVAFILKPLKAALRDGDHIHAVIRASAANNDGASNGITAPNPAAQESVIMKAWEKAGISPESVSYVETHGTGTLLGDPIEVKALNNAFRNYTSKKQFCGIGSVKSNMGHLVAASGCVGMMKVILSMENHMLPASINFEEPNPHINFIDSALYVVDKTLPWEQKDGKLKAGVSSFGFSGTNVHVIIEEAPDIAELEKTEQAHVLTLSAKVKWSLEQLVARYYRFLKKHDVEPYNLEDICFTENTGRGHYNYRLAVVFKDYSQLKDRIEALYYHGLETDEENEIYYGYYKIVSDKRTDRGEGEYTETEIRDININASRLTEQIVKEEVQRNDLLSELSRCYVCGGYIDWQKLYDGKSCRKVSLPTYPFEKIVYWGDVKESKVAEKNQSCCEKYNMPLLERCVVKSVHEDIYAVTFSLKKHWILREHIITGKNIIPGTAYIELGSEVASRYYDEMVEFRDLVFMTPLAVEPGEEVEAQIAVTKEANGIKFTVASRNKVIDGDKEWIIHAEGKAYPVEENPNEVVDISNIDQDETLSRFEIKLATLEDKDAIMNFGPRWHNVVHVYTSPDRLFVHAKLPDEYLDDMKEYRFHTSMLDSTINAGIQAVLEGVYLPFAFKSIKLLAPLPEEVYSLAVKKEKSNNNNETFTYDVWLMDCKGNVVVKIEDYTVKKVHKFNDYEEKPFYQIEWLPDTKQIVKDMKKRNVLVFRGDRLVTDKLLEQGKSAFESVIQVTLGENYQKVSENQYIVASEQDYEVLVDEIKDRGIDTVIHAATMDSCMDQVEIEAFEKEMNQSIYGLFYFTKALMTRKFKGNLDFVLLTEYAQRVTGQEKTIQPLNNAYLGFGKCMVQEYPNFKVRCIDIDEETASEVILDELLNSIYELKTALRNGKRYTECLSKLSSSTEGKKLIEIKDGCTIVTGGLGGLGLVMAKYFAQNGVKNICLISRKSSTTEVMDKIREIEHTGANVLVRSGDVSDFAQMKNIVEELKDAYGRINGLVHCAGIAGDGFIINKTMDTFATVIKPKIQGTKVLDTLLGEEELDFCILFSSMTTLLGGAGQSDYTAANSYLDSYAQYRRLSGKHAISINWSAWKETGMAVDYMVADEMVLFQSVSNQEAIEVMEEMISRNVSNIIPAEINYALFAHVSDSISIHLSDGIQKAVARQKKKQESLGAGKKKETDIKNIAIVGKGTEEYTQTEKTVAYIYAGVLDLTEIDVFESFNSMGGDSMISTEVLSILNKEFDNILDVSDMFSYPTVVEMAEYIDQKRNVDNSSKIENGQLTDMLKKFEEGDIDVEQMIDFFGEEKE